MTWFAQIFSIAAVRFRGAERRNVLSLYGIKGSLDSSITAHFRGFVFEYFLVINHPLQKLVKLHARPGGESTLTQADLFIARSA
jgi:hypothetical protein